MSDGGTPQGPETLAFSPLVDSVQINAGHRSGGLEKIVEASGGRILRVPVITGAGAAFADILAELRGQYALGYYPADPRRDGSWRKVEVDVGGRRRVRTQSGYYDRRRTP